MKSFFFMMMTIMFFNLSFAQSSPEHRIVFQLTTSDTLSHKALMKQLGNILTLSPTSQLEVVCHGPGLSMLVEKSSIVSNKIKDFSGMGVSFMACQFLSLIHI